MVTANSVSNSGRHIPSSSDNLKAKGAKALERITAGDTTLRSASLVSLAMSNTLLALLLSSVADVSSSIIVAFVEMQHGLNVDVLFTGPLHQIAHKFGGFGGIVDVVHQISYSINNH